MVNHGSFDRLSSSSEAFSLGNSPHLSGDDNPPGPYASGPPVLGNHLHGNREQSGALICPTQSFMATLQCINWHPTWIETHRWQQCPNGSSTTSSDRCSPHVDPALPRKDSVWSRPPSPAAPSSQVSRSSTPPPQIPPLAASQGVLAFEKFETRLAQFDDMVEHFLCTLHEGELLRRTPEPPSAVDSSAPAADTSVAGVLVRRNYPYLAGGGPTEVIPRGLVAKDRITVIPYRSCVNDTAPAPPRSRTGTGRDGPQIKLGGVWMELGSHIITVLVEKLTCVRVLYADMFRSNQGRCSLFLQDPKSAPTLIQILDKRLWLGPPGAIYAHTETAAARLQQYIHSLREKSRWEHHHWPRHLVTVERWYPKSEFRKLDIVRTAPSIHNERCALVAMRNHRATPVVVEDRQVDAPAAPSSIPKPRSHCGIPQRNATVKCAALNN